MLIGQSSSRTAWMMALGPTIRQGVVYDRPVQSIDLVPSLGVVLGFSPVEAPGKPITELV